MNRRNFLKHLGAIGAAIPLARLKPRADKVMSEAPEVDLVSSATMAMPGATLITGSMVINLGDDHILKSNE